MARSSGLVLEAFRFRFSASLLGRLQERSDLRPMIGWNLIGISTFLRNTDVDPPHAKEGKSGKNCGQEPPESIDGMIT